jgi:phage protein D
MIANKEVADENGYFFAVLEAELIEISAVVKGSNTITPTISVTESIEASMTTSTNIEPVKSTQKKVDYSKLKFI